MFLGQLVIFEQFWCWCTVQLIRNWNFRIVCFTTRKYYTLLKTVLLVFTKSAFLCQCIPPDSSAVPFQMDSDNLLNRGPRNWPLDCYRFPRGSGSTQVTLTMCSNTCVSLGKITRRFADQRICSLKNVNKYCQTAFQRSCISLILMSSRERHLFLHTVAIWY